MTEIITKIAKNAVTATKGVAGFSVPIDILVIHKQKDMYDIDLFLLVYYKTKIPNVAWNVQENVKKALQENNIFCVDHINIHIQGIEFKEDEDEQN